MFCRYCGKELEDGSRFCRHCGNQIESERLIAEDVRNDEHLMGDGNTQIQNLGDTEKAFYPAQDVPLSDYIIPLIFSAAMLIVMVFVPWLQKASYWIWENPNMGFLTFLQLTPEDSTAAITFSLMKAICIAGIGSNGLFIYFLLVRSKNSLDIALNNAKIQIFISIAFVFGTYITDQYMRGLDPFHKTYSRTETPEQMIALQIGVIIYFLLALAEVIYAKVMFRRHNLKNSLEG
ncbi:zinc-ribbon domain-containing protein [Pseudoflavonifractor sp. BIOML-A6]|jgi:hypothetical protein|nr:MULTISPECIES: zinc ribbon domain-containing protein [unclassified Pseudoflavonifractor]KAB4839032.1 zinc ribbon domain-containing protein [Bacteroides thetaiotaomicron]MTQ96006.1 zinc-ribbon domain-containing protein [Pseudoflavonifractor sp. BIOML-A16]MTR04758.1 zinc-ribbon domain-containing protein [Pseudoflavonifractor sp. BIOML-A15]MTR30994.1 zinc-ribbon domain-containing protein [Pseudoflavonifractor sp. BIOML-A14]MTR71559.1 zinc-ribbon domain-containing protein [Pseudoflavonifractor s